MAQGFWNNGRSSPLHDKNNTNKLSHVTHELIQAYNNQDPGQNREEAITPHHLIQIQRYIKLISFNTKSHHKDIADLLIGAFFFAMRSCKYTKVNSPGRTKILTIGDITFLDKKHKIINQQQPNLITKARYVTITFRNQKNGHKNAKRTHGRTDNKTLCPVRSWASVITRIRTRQTNDSTPVSFFWDDNKNTNGFFKQSNVIDVLRYSANLFKTKLPYTSDRIGSHSLRSGAAMAIFLANADTLDIMILGRWSSDAFLLYIRPYVQETTATLGQRMILNKTYHNTIQSTQRNSLYLSNRSKNDPSKPSNPRKVTSMARKRREHNNGSNSKTISFPKLHVL